MKHKFSDRYDMLVTKWGKIVADELKDKEWETFSDMITQIHDALEKHSKPAIPMSGPIGCRCCQHQIEGTLIWDRD